MRTASSSGEAPHCDARTSSSTAGLVSTSGRVRALPPPSPNGYWRLSIFDRAGRRTGQTTGGRTRASAERRIAEVERRLAVHSPAGSNATKGDELLDYFLDETRPKNLGHPDRSARWSLTYTDQVRQLVNGYLRPELGRAALWSWDVELAYRVLDRCPTNYTVGKVRGILSGVLGVGVRNGFLRADQRQLHQVAVPLRADRRPSRHPRARCDDVATLLRPDAVPSLDQVAGLATAPQPGTTAQLWEATVNALAYGGFRIGEWLALSDEDVLGCSPRGLIRIQHQLVEPDGRPKQLAPPKNGFARLAAVCELTPVGFPLRAWLTARAEEAAREKATGLNPHGTLMLSPRGLWWTRSNLRTRCFCPAATAAGWERLTWRGPVRRRVAGHWAVVETDRQDWRHTLHSLRHHYATTARDRWGWTGAELCLNGGWADASFVVARYYGSSADTYAQAVAKQEPTHEVDRPVGQRR